MSLTTRGHRGTPQLDALPSGGNSPQLSPFALAREPVVPATRSILRLLRPSDPTPVPGDPHATLISRLDRDSLAALTRNRCPVHSGCQRGNVFCVFARFPCRVDVKSPLCAFWLSTRQTFPVPVGSGRAPGPFPGARGPCPQPALFVVEGRRCPVTFTHPKTRPTSQNPGR